MVRNLNPHQGIDTPHARYDFVPDPIRAVVGMQELSWTSAELFGVLSGLYHSVQRFKCVRLTGGVFDASDRALDGIEIGRITKAAGPQPKRVQRSEFRIDFGADCISSLNSEP